MPGGNDKGCRRMVKYGDEINKQVIAIVDTNCSTLLAKEKLSYLVDQI